ncbi:hypothetical protein N657DRAFT_615763 [Parathielavia appendiculata]|uniref:Uncharacterized protein n=1 Tax=Parathielavia appendiculata TaxID=2587402 RepID=A0AAN6U1T2_9PEZI|nr:hypothetical protein N657DRAFT_615763 [Parathielavia appendiculata]
MSEQGPGRDQLNDIAQRAERDLNTYQSKTGTGKGRASGLEDFGVNATIDQKFPGSTVKVGENNITNRSYNRRIPADEGGDVDETGRPGKIDEATVKGWGKDPRQLEREMVDPSRPDLLPLDEAVGGRRREPARQGDVSEQGRLAAKSNVGLEATSREEVPSQGSRGSQFKGEYYEAPESVPDQRSDQNEVPPESVTGRSRNI